METEILKYILNNHGAVVTAELLFDLCDTSTLSEIICKNEKFVTCLFNGTPKIVVRSSVKLCWRKDCPGCGALHLCKGFFLTGSCPFTLKRRGCIFSHNLHSEYNESILREFELETLSRTQLCVLLLQSNNNLLPPICYNYNNRSGCQDSCQRLHICEKFLSQDCSCFRTHDFSAPQPSKLLQDRRIPDSLISSLKSVYANKEALHLADKLDSRRNRADRGTDSEAAIDYGSSQGTLNTGNDTNSSSNVRSSRGRGVQGRRGQFRGGRGNGGSRQDISSSDLAAGSLSFVNSNYNFNLPGHEPVSTSAIVDNGFDINSSNWGGRSGFGKGTNTGTRDRGGKGSLSNHFQSEGIHSQNDLPVAKKEVDFTYPKQGLDKRQRQGQRDKTEICMYFIKGHCKHEDRCFKAHDKMPYRWEIKQDGQWTRMAENENIEQAYCDPANAYSTTSPFVYFDTMTCGEKEVRRLSTINSVLEPGFIHTTDWLWFWEDDHGKWLQYGAHTSVHGLASVTSKQLEEMCLNNNKDVVQFKAGSQSYELSFQDMIQTNIEYGTKRIVRRRPRFVSAVEVQTKRKRPTNTTTFPDYWDKAQISPTEHRCISLQPSLGEYKEIHDLFCQTMKGFDILKIERVQNKAVWEAFQLHKNHLKNKNNGQSVAEKKLFHGTDALLVNTICATNFDWRVCGVNGTAYGQGSYFARDAKYSHSYTGTSDVRFMFVSRVLVGEYTRGRSEYRRPPSKDGGDVNLYDSCVDNVSNPSIFVVFEKQQIYPEYVLQYRERGRQPAALVTVITPPVAVSNSSAASVSTNALATNPTALSSTSPSIAVLPNLVTTSSSGSSNASVTHPTTTSTANALTSKSVTKSPTASSNAFVTHPTTTFSTSSPNAFPSSPPPTSTRLSDTWIKYPTQSSSFSSANPFQTNPTTASSISSSKAFVTNPHRYTSDSSFRFSPTLNPTTSTTRATSTFSASSQRKKQSTCVVA